MLSTKPHFGLAVTVLRSQMSFRAKAFVDVLNSIVFVLVTLLVWNALYGSERVAFGVPWESLATSLVLGIGLANAFSMDDNYIANRIRSGEIELDLLRPMSLPSQVLMRELGRTTHKLLVEFIPILACCSLFVTILPAASPYSAILALVSIILAWGILFQLSLVVSLISLWYFNIWSFSILKNSLVLVFSGASLPYWFFPDWIAGFAFWSPFGSLFSTPLSIYFGKSMDLGLPELIVARQLVWLLVLYSVAQVLWYIGRRRLSIQGG